MMIRLLPFIAVALGAWQLVGDVQALVDEIGLDENVWGTVARTLADLLLLYFGGQALKQRREAISPVA